MWQETFCVFDIRHTILFIISFKILKMHWKLLQSEFDFSSYPFIFACFMWHLLVKLGLEIFLSSSALFNPYNCQIRSYFHHSTSTVSTSVTSLSTLCETLLPPLLFYCDIYCAIKGFFYYSTTTQLEYVDHSYSDIVILTEQILAHNS